MIVASQFGWSAISPEPMNFHDLLLAAQLMSEERVGKPLRAAERATAERDRQAMRRLGQIKR